jgi:hypothetical protein
MENYDPLHLLAFSFGFSALAGFAVLLYSNRQLNWRSGIATFLRSGFLGVTVALILYNSFGGEQPAMIVAAAVLAGMGLIDPVAVTLIVTNAITKALSNGSEKEPK